MAPVRADVSSRRRIHFHGFGVARQGPWCTVEKVGVGPVGGPREPENEVKTLRKRRIQPLNRGQKRVRRGFSTGWHHLRTRVNNDIPSLSYDGAHLNNDSLSRLTQQSLTHEAHRSMALVALYSPRE